MVVMVGFKDFTENYTSCDEGNRRIVDQGRAADNSNRQPRSE
jgi:hypothetical protein